MAASAAAAVLLQKDEARVITAAQKMVRDSKPVSLRLELRAGDTRTSSRRMSTASTKIFKTWFSAVSLKRISYGLVQECMVELARAIIDCGQGYWVVPDGDGNMVPVRLEWEDEDTEMVLHVTSLTDIRKTFPHFYQAGHREVQRLLTMGDRCMQ